MLLTWASCKLYLDTADYDYQSNNAYTGKMYFKVLHLPCGGGGEVTSPYSHMLTPNYICACGWLKITWLMILYIYFRKCQNDETVKNLGPHSKIPILSEDRMIINIFLFFFDYHVLRITYYDKN